jgi:hypothetical protein
MTDGYRHPEKPFLRMLELYVLWAIGELPQANQDSLSKIAPKLQSMY